MSLQNINFLQLDVQALSVKNKELSQTVVKLKMENAELQNRLVSMKGEIFEKKFEVNTLRNDLDMFASKMQLCLPKISEIVKIFSELQQYYVLHKSMSTPVVRLERLNVPQKKEKSVGANTCVYTKPFTISGSDLHEEEAKKICNESMDESTYEVPELLLSTIAEENVTNITLSNQDLSEKLQRSSSVSPLELSNLHTIDEIENDQRPFDPPQNTFFQTPSISNMGDKTELNSTPSSPTNVNRSLTKLRKTLNSLQTDNIESPKPSFKLEPKRLVVEVLKMPTELTENGDNLRDFKVVLDATEVENKSPKPKKTPGQKKSSKRKGSSKKERKKSEWDSDGSSVDRSPKTRPKRAARPLALKEPSLNKKMRRSK